MPENEAPAKHRAKAKSRRKSKPRLGRLTFDEFRSVLAKVRGLGLTWTADIPPRLIAEKPETEAALFSPDFRGIQKQYPDFPRDVGAAVFYALTGMSTVQDSKLLAKKAEVLRDSGLITESYRSEFFFKHAIKVPYFSDLDWEVVLKTYERNVAEPPTISYALLSLELRGRNQKHRTVVAVDERMTEKLIQSLSEVKLALEKSKRVQDAVRTQLKPEKSQELKDATTKNPNHLE